MKERKRNVFGVRRILSAVFAVGFVVALLSTINAFAAANLFKIQNAELSDLSAGATGAISTFDETNIESNVTFHKLDDSAKYTITLKNTDSKDHVIQSITDDNDNPYVSYEYSSYANTVVKAGESFDFVVTAKYANAVTDKNARAQATNVKFFLQFTDIEEPEVIPITPNTGDNIMLSVAILAISATGLIVCAAIAIKRNKKTAKYLAVVIVAVAAVAVTAGVKAATVEINSISITSNYGLYDKSVVTWTDANGDEHEEFVPYNEPANIQDPDKPGYIFTGWEDEDGNPVDPSEPITEDIKIHPTFRANKYTIKFDGNGATGSMDNIEMTYDEAKTLPANTFVLTGRTYMGWDTEANGSGVHHDDQAEVKNLTTEDNGVVTLYAQWSVNPFFINYDGNGATSGEMATTNCDYDQSCILRDNAFSKPGYHFTGWKYNNNDYANKADVKNIIESGTITMVAQWAVNHYTIVFDINTDDASTTGNMADMTNLEYDHDYTLTANAFARTGYNFGGWNTEIDGRNFGLSDAQEFHNLTTTDNAVITLYAQWNPIHYTIAFHQNSDGVTGNMSSQVFTYDEAKNLTQNAFIKNHYKFMGWTTAANGTGTKYDDRASIFNLTTEDGATIDLYAQWKERTAYLKGTVNNSWGSAGDMIRSLQGYSAATSFSHYEGEPNFDEIGTKYNMAISSSNFPVYTWIDGETIYWWSEAETIYAHEDSRNFFSGLKKAETIDYSGFNFSLTKNLAGFFRNTAALSTIDLSPLAAANPTTLEEMFNGSGIASVDLSPLNATQTTNMKGMFNSATALETVNLSAIDTTNVTDMSYLFSDSTNLKSVDFSHNNLSSVEDMNHMFYGDKKLESLNFAGVNTPNLKKMSWMFGGAKIASLDLSDLDTGNVTHFDELFYYADVANLDISGFDTQNAATFGSMFTAFNAHGQVLDLSHFDTTSLNGSMYEMFNRTNASAIDLSSFDISAERAANIGMANILNISNNVETIYATEKLHLHDYSSVPDTNLGVPMDYGGQSKLVGGAGSTLRQLTLLGLSEYDKARIDDPCNGKPGMFAVKNAQYICYNANIPSGETGAGAQAGEYLTVGTNHLKDDAFTRQGYTLLGWATSANGDVVYASGDEITIAEESKTPLELYAQWYRLNATLDTGANVNTILKNLATEPTAFEHYAAGTPNFDVIDGEQDIALPTSDVPVYAWYDTESTKIYWWSEAEKPKMNTDSSSFFAEMSSVTSIDFEGLDASNATNMSHMFRGTGLTDIDFSKLESQNVTDMSYMFHGIKKTNTLDVSKLDTSSVKNMASMFEGASFTSVSFLDALNPSASKFKTNEVTSMHYMFKDSTKLTSLDLSSFNTSNVKDFSGTFYGATGLNALNLDGWDTGSATSMYIMFNGATSLTRLDLRHFNTKNVTTMQQMFEGCFNLEYLNVSGWSNEAVKNMSYMFHKVGNYKNGVEIILTGFKTPAVTTMAYMFSRDVTELEALDLSGFDTSNVTSMSSMFGGGSQGNGTFYNAKIKTVYASDKFVTTNVDPESNVFNNTTVIVGGAGTTWSQKTAVFARIDDPDNGNQGYFTLKGARYIRYMDNDGDDTNNEANYALMTSHYLTNTGSLKTNQFTNAGKSFAGWNTAADGSGDSYTDGQLMSDLVESKTPLTLYAQWDNRSYLQDATAASLEELVPNSGDTATLYDRRDGEAYTIGRLADGKVWTLDDLRLDLVETPMNKLVGNTNASESSLAYLKNGGGTTGDQYAIDGVTLWANNQAGSYSRPMIYTGKKGTTVTNGYTGTVGIYYNYCAASAGTYCYGNGTHSDPDSGVTRISQLTDDICPKGWHMPTYEYGSRAADLNGMTASYSNRANIINAFHAAFTGAIDEDGEVTALGNNIYVSSSTPEARWSPPYMSISYDFSAYYFYLPATWGKSIRCVAD